MSLVLVVEDEVDLSHIMRDRLIADGHEVVVVHDGAAAMAAVAKRVPDCVLLDWLLPDVDGLTVCRRLRESHLMPIIMVTARTEEVDRVLGLEVGADDYLVKPFGLRELLARARAALRRVELEARRGQPNGGEEQAIVHGPLRVEPGSHRATLNGTELALTPKEFELLH